ncbi:contact-dependent growth inhibition system immunity protein [Cupriavidus sp. 2KB_3]|uniref:contact-dependent growth inhibition system immunity protein n=1 Tax=Cupriavidus TaxID=106589 RepID=UPI0011ECD683|nr:contact-dependent growth inhibition system immunity protein [Cupriavidus campinensis]
MTDSRYPELWQLIGAYFNQDFDMVGNSIEDLIAVYISESDPATRKRVIQDIERFMAENRGAIEEAYRREFGEEIDWGISHEAFLRKVEHLIHISL